MVVLAGGFRLKGGVLFQGFLFSAEANGEGVLSLQVSREWPSLATLAIIARW